MRQFFKFVFASCLGIFLFFIVCFLILMLIGLGSSGDSFKLAQNSVLQLKFDKPIPEKTNNLPFQFSGFSKADNEILGMNDILEAIRHAKTDKKIKGIMLDISGFQGGFAKAASIRHALKDFAGAGKFVMTYGDYYSQGSYYLSSVATKVYLHPIGMVDLRGLGSQIPFMKDFLDKIGVKAQVFYAGKFKSATEPFRFSKMSEENRYQIKEYLGDLNTNMMRDIAESRKLSLSELMASVNAFDGHDPDLSLEKKLVDKLGYYSDMIAEMKSKIGLKPEEKLNIASLSDYVTTYSSSEDFSSKDKIAVVYAEGEIKDGKTEYGEIGSKNYASIFKKIAEDKNVRAIVLRVNSPGGSAVASETILHEIQNAKSKGIPVVVSMGDFAASGGYYISCAADSIFAEPNTLTGSIGVFSVFPNVQEMMNKKLGINFDTVSTGKYANAFSPFFLLNQDESRIMQRFTDKIYNVFLQRVAKARKSTTAQINEVAQGRVWTGQDAVGVNLVDKLGSLDDAIACAKRMAKLKNYRITEYPKIKDPITQIIDELSGVKDDQQEKAIRAHLGVYYEYYGQLKKLNEMRGPQMRMPFDLNIR
ncbi:MAG TPA: signal peptide peptidase SppA [Saprospiraceae bacterium]|nr:signal peptide peptidase SppA [Saprospiraceae bacterium]HMV24656.1 signal peptide peptidase SppA [Saprospiraceae bacterium]HMW75313.1 signal peptide peptidase SppA [Saprospiraceae bacterium]HMX82653.1 signal peptide peptidase SppA [Saprospiraceae bacterium]HMX84805.1 signal peptide peptidase SppA [Saprospiraceae bacterium]